MPAHHIGMGFPYAAPTGKQTTVPAATVSTALLASNPDRRGASVYNDSSAVLYLAMGSAASTSAWSVKLDAGDFWESPFSYTGPIAGVWDSATGQAQVTEFS